MKPAPSAARFFLVWRSDCTGVLPIRLRSRAGREERLVGTRKIRDQIRARVEMWCDEVCAVETGAADSVPSFPV